MRYRAGVLRCAPVASLLRLPSLGYTVDFPLGYALSRGCSLPVDCATLHPAGCLRQSFSLRSIMSPYGLPSAGYPASARWHVFAPAQLIHRLSRPAPPSELPCGSLSRPSPKVSIRPSGQPSVALGSAALRLPTLGYTFVSPLVHCAFARVFSRLPRRSIV